MSLKVTQTGSRTLSMTATLASFSPRVLMATFSPGILTGREEDAVYSKFISLRSSLLGVTLLPWLVLLMQIPVYKQTYNLCKSKLLTQNLGFFWLEFHIVCRKERKNGIQVLEGRKK